MISALALTSAAAVAASVSGLASAATTPGTLYRESTTQAATWVEEHPSDSRTPVIRDKIAGQPVGHWFASYDPAGVTSEVAEVTGPSAAAGEVPVLVPYMLPNRDCGGASAGGAPDLPAYEQWVDTFAQGLGTGPVIVILEPDSIALQTCLSPDELRDRNQALSEAVQKIKSADPDAKVYLDAGHSAWNGAEDQASRLRSAGIQVADGFYTNVSNFQSLDAETAYGKAINQALASAGITGKHQVIDTSRNGGAAGDWCGDDNTDRRIGTYPRLDTGAADIDGYLWVKHPGEADGCSYQAGSFQPDLAYGLAADAPSPPAGG